MSFKKVDFSLQLNLVTASLLKGWQSDHMCDMKFGGEALWIKHCCQAARLELALPHICYVNVKEADHIAAGYTFQK